jgi:HPt (histidine-containing phosphotransfer) domain-containing protein
VSLSPHPGTNTPLVLDEAQIEAICGGDREFENLVCGEFRATSVAAFEELAKAVAGRDAPPAKAWAHAIKGSAATLGGQALARVCQQIETQAANGPEWELVASLLIAARAEFARLERALEARAGAG